MNDKKIKVTTIKNTFIKVIIAVFCTALIFFITACVNLNANKPDLCSWLVYWDSASSLQEITQNIDKLTSVQIFSAVFDSNDKLTMPKGFDGFEKDTEKLMSLCKQKNKDTYLTIVNDRFNPDGTATQKDTSLLKRLFSNEQTISGHIADITAIAKSGGYNGVEIDYEKIDKNDYTSFALFCSKLYESLKAEKIKLRIIVEPAVPLEKLDMPQNAEYMVMVYNLYGTHSGPGPKADKDFIEKTLSKFAECKGKKWAAFSTGGFDWAEDGKIASLTEQAAVKLLQSNNSAAIRDSASGSLYFDYADSQGVKHTVWYADAETIRQWAKIAKNTGCKNIALWRAGGNSNEIYIVD